MRMGAGHYIVDNSEPGMLSWGTGQASDPFPVRLYDLQHATSQSNRGWIHFTTSDENLAEGITLDVLMDLPFWLVDVSFDYVPDELTPWAGKLHMVADVLDAGELDGMVESARHMGLSRPPVVSLSELWDAAPDNKPGGYRGGGRPEREDRPRDGRRMELILWCTDEERERLYELLPDDARRRFECIMALLEGDR